MHPESRARLLHSVMARKRKQPELDLETIFATLYSKVDASSQSDEIRSFLGKVKMEIGKYIG
jgi:gamma-glutamylcysteine synthetase